MVYFCHFRNFICCHCNILCILGTLQKSILIITCPGDIGKAFGAGADFVISGSLFSGCEEADGDLIEINGKKTRANLNYIIDQERINNKIIESFFIVISPVYIS